MELIRQVLMQKLISQGILEVGGKPVEDVSVMELQDGWHRFELMKQDERVDRGG
ncbi:hypothetical protein [Brevibacillus sp. H7]|uniref:hypothetical protein n=1 Tax=Brevibacillus sp. H7 TaxID=3349138 RepID=UPI00382063E5